MFFMRHPCLDPTACRNRWVFLCVEKLSSKLCKRYSDGSTFVHTKRRRIQEDKSLHNYSLFKIMDLIFERMLGNMYGCIYRFQNVFLRCPTPTLHCFLSSHWPSFRFLSFMIFFIPSIQFFFGLPRALFGFGIHFNAILGSLSSAILWTWPYHVSWICSISSPICFLVVNFLIPSFLDILENLLRASISVASTRLLLFTVSPHIINCF